MKDITSFLKLSEAISDAAGDPAAWPLFLEKFATAVGSNSVSLHWEKMDADRRSKFAFRYGLAPAASAEYERYYGPRNPVVAGAGDLIVPGRGVLRQEACSDKTFLSSEFYNDFLKPNDFLHVLGGTIAIRGPEICIISVLGSHQREAFTAEDKGLLEALIPHMRTALVLHDRLAAAQDRLVRVETAFDMSPDAAVLVDDRAVLLAANESARMMLESRDGIYIEQDRLRIRNQALDAKLVQILKGLGLAKRFGLQTPPGSAFRVPRPSRMSHWQFQIFPVEKRMSGAAVVFIVPSDVSDSPGESDLEALFDLSPMQSWIALRLFAGQELSDIEENLGIGRNTLKTHLRRLFDKLGIRRQTELVRVLGKLKPRR
jgi:DNA-binding CsgD family transcriptional regulator